MNIYDDIYNDAFNDELEKCAANPALTTALAISLFSGGIAANDHLKRPSRIKRKVEKKIGPLSEVEKDIVLNTSSKRGSGLGYGLASLVTGGLSIPTDLLIDGPSRDASNKINHLRDFGVDNSK